MSDEPDVQESSETAQSSAPVSKAEAKRQKQLRKFDTENDIRYRGPLSYRWFRIIGWLCLACAGLAILLNLDIAVFPRMPRGSVFCLRRCGGPLSRR